MNGQVQLLELRGKVTSQVAKNDVMHDTLRLRICFPYRIRWLTMSSGSLILIFNVSNSVHINVTNRRQVTAALIFVWNSFASDEGKRTISFQCWYVGRSVQPHTLASFIY